MQSHLSLLTLVHSSPESSFHHLMHTHKVLGILTCARDRKTSKRVFGWISIYYWIKYFKYNVISGKIMYTTCHGRAKEESIQLAKIDIQLWNSFDVNLVTRRTLISDHDSSLLLPNVLRLQIFFLPNSSLPSVVITYLVVCLPGDFREAPSNRNIMQDANVSHLCNFKFSRGHVNKSKKKQMKLILILYWI